MRKSVASATWSDVASGDGGQVLVDPTDANFVYGTYFGISPYASPRRRVLLPNQIITRGIDLSDRSDVLHPDGDEQAEPEPAVPRHVSAVPDGHRPRRRTRPACIWKPISGDLTAGCPGTAPNGARGCILSAIGVGGGQAVYTGSEDGTSTSARMPRSTAARPGRASTRRSCPSGPSPRSRSTVATTGSPTSPSPASTRRPRQARATSGTRTAGASGRHQQQPAGRPGQLGHPRPDVPEHALRRHRRRRVRHVQRRRDWAPLGMASRRCDLAARPEPDQTQRVLAAGTHGRGAFRRDDVAPVPALVVAKVDAGVPVGPRADRLHADAARTSATPMRRASPSPIRSGEHELRLRGNGGTSRAARSRGRAHGAEGGGGVPGSLQVTFTVSIAAGPEEQGEVDHQRRHRRDLAQGPGTTGSPT